jgi:hypothetical protein
MAVRAAISRVAFQTGWDGKPQWRLDLSDGTHVYLPDSHPIIREAIKSPDGTDSLLASDLILETAQR